MRAAIAVPFFCLMSASGFAQSPQPGISPSSATDRNEARWADLEAQARMTDGDYDGAVQAEKRAEAARSKAEQQEMTDRSSKRP